MAFSPQKVTVTYDINPSQRSPLSLKIYQSLASAPTDPCTPTSFSRYPACRSLKVRASKRFRESMMFSKLEVS